MKQKSLLLGDAEVVSGLADRLSRCPAVQRLDSETERQAWTLAVALGDLEQSFHAIVDTLLPKLLDPSLTEDEMLDTLLEIGEELRHIKYHIRDTKFYSYLG